MAVNWSFARVTSESELFGYAEGAFTGNVWVRLVFGCSWRDDFLDEIDAMPVNVQGRLLRVLQERRFFAREGNPNRYPRYCRYQQTTREVTERGLDKRRYLLRLNVLRLDCHR